MTNRTTDPTGAACNYCAHHHHHLCAAPCACAAQRHTPTTDLAARMRRTVRPDLAHQDVTTLAAQYRTHRSDHADVLAVTAQLGADHDPQIDPADVEWADSLTYPDDDEIDQLRADLDPDDADRLDTAVANLTDTFAACHDLTDLTDTELEAIAATLAADVLDAHPLPTLF